MIVAVSTSSPLVGVALFAEDGGVIEASSVQARAAASGACLSLLESLLQRNGLLLHQATLFAADLGPGSFTGVKVGVTLVKTWAFAFGVPVTGADSFDLIDPEGTVAIPSKRGEFFIRRVGFAAIRAPALPEGPFAGYGPGIEPQAYPSAERFAPLLRHLPRLRPEELVPNHLLEPSISLPKKPYAAGGAAHSG